MEKGLRNGDVFNIKPLKILYANCTRQFNGILSKGNGVFSYKMLAAPVRSCHYHSTS